MARAGNLPDELRFMLSHPAHNEEGGSSARAVEDFQGAANVVSYPRGVPRPHVGRYPVRERLDVVVVFYINAQAIEDSWPFFQRVVKVFHCDMRHAKSLARTKPTRTLRCERKGGVSTPS